ncbi:SseB family protein [Geomonas sp. Red69]|uniref:SseB family protein n=1 Tax=Geomonas diazotrophica TaxID=2843197 RepID=A0ABX8JQ93_9BACT|nr:MULTISPECIES: SseB family protein [Geomonas]MBU5636903.1 SseB family protein [Geomonas diazotrophica]QWV98799.1 SseB family protein [Geomonas nitrogeniifigens]
MEKLDEALVNLRQNMSDGKKQCEFYDLFLNSSFFVPILSESEQQEESGGVMPLITEADGKDYLMLFSTLERLHAWDATVRYLEAPGYLLALRTVEPLNWALNAGTDYSKQFHPEEIAWLRESVERCNAEAAGGQQA